MVELSKLKKRMSIIAADGQRIGFVTRMAGPDRIRITSLSGGHGYDHIIPLNWVSAIDKYVHLSRTSRFVTGNWEHAPGRLEATKKAPLLASDGVAAASQSRPQAV